MLGVPQMGSATRPAPFVKHAGPALLWWGGLACAVLLVSLAAFDFLAAQPPTGGELRVGLPALPQSLDPALAADESEVFVVRQLFDSLVQYKEGTTDIEPGLATSWTVSRDGLSWNFHLRDGVLFHDGAPLTAEAVVASYGRIMLEGHPLHPKEAVLWPRVFGGIPGLVRTVTATAPRTVTFQLGQPYAPFLTALAHPAFAVALITEVEEGRVINGTGPFRLEERASDRIALRAHPGHWAGVPRFDRVVFSQVGDDAKGLQDVEAGVLHLYWPRLLTGIQGGRSILMTMPGLRVGFLAMNVGQDPWSRKKLRQAVGHAIDPAIVGPALGRDAVVAHGWLPPGMWGGPGVSLPAYQSARSRDLAQEARVAPETSVSLLFPSSHRVLDLARVVEALRIGLGAPGIQVQPRPEKPEEVSRLARSGQHEMVLQEVTSEIGDPHQLLSLLTASEEATKGSASNWAFYRNPRLEDLLLRGSQLGFRPERLRHYQRAMAILNEDLPWIPLYVLTLGMVARSEVHEFRLHPTGAHRLSRIWLEGPQPLPPPMGASTPPPPPSGQTP